MRNRLFADISNNNQQSMNFEAYAEGGGHMILGHKASEGTGFKDQFHDERCERVHAKAHAWVLHYHFGHVGDSVTSQAHFFWSICHGHFAKHDFACIDTERGAANDGFSIDQVTRWTNAFDVAFRKISGHSLIVYSNESLMREMVRNGLRVAGNRGWIAAYGPNKPSIGGISTWAWQYTDGVIGPTPHHYAGIGNCDGSKLNARTYLRLLAAGKP